MDVRVRFAPSPTGSLHLGGALTAVANRRFADERDGVLVLRIDDTDAARSDRARRGRDRGRPRVARRSGGTRARFARASAASGTARPSARCSRAVRRTTRRARSASARSAGRRSSAPTASATYHLASVVDDAELGITHVIRGKDHLSNTPLHEALARALGAEPPEYIHHGLILGPDGAKLSKRHGAPSIADLRDAGVPAEAVRAYLDELDLPRADVHLDLARIERLADRGDRAHVRRGARGADRRTAAARAGDARRAQRSSRPARPRPRSSRRRPDVVLPDGAERDPRDASSSCGGAQRRARRGRRRRTIIRELKAVGAISAL